MTLRSLLLFLLGALACLADSAAIVADGQPGEEVLARYLDQVRTQSVQLRDLDMDVEIEAELPRLNRKGKLSALRSVSKVGQITYRAITFQGDDAIKRDVIARYMQAEIEGSKKPGLGINRENYKFRYAGSHGSGDWELHLYQVTARKKLPGLFNGWVWVEAKTGLPVREQGEFVKSPSVFLRRIDFVRDFLLEGGKALPVSIASTIETRIVGRAEIRVSLSNYHPAGAGQQTAQAENRATLIAAANAPERN